MCIHRHLLYLLIQIVHIMPFLRRILSEADEKAFIAGCGGNKLPEIDPRYSRKRQIS